MKLPPYQDFPTLYLKNIILRQILEADIKDLIEISFYDAIQATTLEEAIEMQAKIDADYSDGNSIHWGIADKESDKIVGTCGYYRGLDKGAGELGCILMPQFRGYGYMTTAIEAAIEFGLKTIGIKRIFAVTTQKNNSALKLLERLNFHKVKEVKDEVEYELRR